MLGVALRDYTLRESMKAVDGFLCDGKVSTIAYITTRGLMAAQSSDRLKEFLAKLDLTVAADSDILRAGGIVNRNRIREVDNDEFMQEFLKKLVRMKKTVYLLTGSAQQMETLRMGLASYQEGLKMIGSYSLDELQEQGYDEDYLVNQINVDTPNVIISNISSPQREEFFEANHMKLNAEVWLMLKDEVVHQKLTKGLFAKLGEWIVKKLFARRVTKYHSELEEETREETGVK